MAIPHARSGQVMDLQPLGAALAGARSQALVKSRDLELVRLVLPQGKRLAPHSVPGELSLLCIEGVVEISVDGEPRPLAAGQLMYLAGGVAHGLLALSDTSLLLTIALHH